MTFISKDMTNENILLGKQAVRVTEPKLQRITLLPDGEKPR